MNNRIYTGSGVGTVVEQNDGILTVRLDNPGNGKLYRKFPEIETLPYNQDQEAEFRKSWMNGLSINIPGTGKRIRINYKAWGIAR